MTEITRLSAAMGLLRNRVHREIPVQHISLLLAVCERPGITMPELMRVLEMPQGTVSRNVKALSHYVERIDGKAVPKGYNLLRTEPDTSNRRVLAVYLTSCGEALIQDLARMLRWRRDDDPAHSVFQVSSPAHMSIREMVAQ